MEGERETSRVKQKKGSREGGMSKSKRERDNERMGIKVRKV